MLTAGSAAFADVPYVLAKIAEQLDAQIYAAIGLGGHGIKHFVSPVAVLFAVLAMLEMKAPQTR